MALSQVADEYEDSYGSWSELAQVVDAHGGVLRVSMADLKPLTGLTRLKVNVVAAISVSLTDVGLGHLPADLPRNQNDSVVVYKLSSYAGAVIDAVRSGASSARAEEALRKLNTSETIQRERENDIKLAELSAKVDELEALLASFREVLDA